MVFGDLIDPTGEKAATNMRIVYIRDMIVYTN